MRKKEPSRPIDMLILEILLLFLFILNVNYVTTTTPVLDLDIFLSIRCELLVESNQSTLIFQNGKINASCCSQRCAACFGKYFIFFENVCLFLRKKKKPLKLCYWVLLSGNICVLSLFNEM